MAGASAAAAAAVVWEAPVPKPVAQMKVLNWTKIPNVKLRGTVWDQLKNHVGATPVDWEELEANFRSATADAADDGPKHKGPRTVSLLAPKRSQAVNIFLKSSRLTPAQLVELIWAADERRLSAEFAEKLIANAPDAEEAEAVQAYCQKHPNSKVLGAPERYFHALSAIPCLRPRLEALVVRITISPFFFLSLSLSPLFVGAFDAPAAHPRARTSSVLVAARGDASARVHALDQGA